MARETLAPEALVFKGGIVKIAQSVSCKRFSRDNLRRRQMRHRVSANGPRRSRAVSTLKPSGDTGKKEESRMKFLSRTLEVKTERGPQFVDITDHVEEAARECGLLNGFA